MLAVGAKQLVAVIDLHQSSVELFNGVGDEGSGDFSPNSSDRTHFSRKGALEIARMVSQGVKLADETLAKHLKESRR